ncbi:hypothetical protein HOK00_01385, partial [bacterium]|nr:hypothetical protein [bacterium]
EKMKQQLDTYVKSILGILNKLEKEENEIVKKFFTDLLHGEQVADLMSKYGEQVAPDSDKTKTLIQIIASVNDNANLIFEEAEEEVVEEEEAVEEEVEAVEEEEEAVEEEVEAVEEEVEAVEEEDKEALREKLEKEAEEMQKKRASNAPGFGKVLLKKTQSNVKDKENTQVKEEDLSDSEEDLEAWGLAE